MRAAEISVEDPGRQQTGDQRREAAPEQGDPAVSLAGAMQKSRQGGDDQQGLQSFAQQNEK